MVRSVGDLDLFWLLFPLFKLLLVLCNTDNTVKIGDMNVSKVLKHGMSIT